MTFLVRFQFCLIRNEGKIKNISRKGLGFRKCVASTVRLYFGSTTQPESGGMVPEAGVGGGGEIAPVPCIISKLLFTSRAVISNNISVERLGIVRPSLSSYWAQKNLGGGM